MIFIESGLDFDIICLFNFWMRDDIRDFRNVFGKFVMVFFFLWFNVF